METSVKTAKIGPSMSDTLEEQVGQSPTAHPKPFKWRTPPFPSLSPLSIPLATANRGHRSHQSSLHVPGRVPSVRPHGEVAVIYVVAKLSGRPHPIPLPLIRHLSALLSPWELYTGKRQATTIHKSKSTNNPNQTWPVAQTGVDGNAAKMP